MSESCTFLIERLHPGPGDQGGARLVEGDVSVWPDAADEELDPARLRYLSLVGVALRLEVGRVAVQQVGVLRLVQNLQIYLLPPDPEDGEGYSYLNINVCEEVLHHVSVVALLVGPWQLHVLIHVEGLHILENEARAFLGEGVTFGIRRSRSYLERDLSLAVGGHQLGVHALRSATRRQPQDEVAKGVQVVVKTNLS